MNNKEFYYVRVSSKEQNITRQLDSLKQFGIEINERDIFIDKSSGKNFNREQYQLLKSILRQGDTLYVLSIDRFGRNYTEILNEWRELTSRNIDIVVLDMPLLDTRNNKDSLGTLISDLVLQLLSYVASSELTNIKSRQKEDISSTKARGVEFGRPKKTIEFNSEFRYLYSEWESKKITTKYFRDTLGLKSNSFYRRIDEYKVLTNNKNY